MTVLAFRECPVDYSGLPEELQPGMRRYLEYGIRPGSFMTSVLMNDFAMAVSHASPTLTWRLKDIAIWLYNQMPPEAWGSREALNSWIQCGGLNGR